jgi:hypothetical protein
MTFDAMAGVRGGGAAQHPGRPQTMLAGRPRVAGGAAELAGGRAWPAALALLHSEDPTVFITHPVLFGDEYDVGDWCRGR